MSPSPVAESTWSTSSFGEAPSASTVELSALRDHTVRCRSAHVSLFALQCGAEAMVGFVAARQVTTLAILSALAGVAGWWF